MRVLRQIVGVPLFLLGTAAIASTSNPVPLINQPPDAAKPGGTAFTLIVNGSGFISGSVVHWNGSPRSTTFVSEGQLKATILATEISIPTATLSATSLTFATQLVGTTSPAQSVTLTNYGPGALSIAKVGLMGADSSDFAQTNNCGSSVGAGASCAINVTFKPTGINTRTASLSISDNATGSPQTISLSGVGTEVELPASAFVFVQQPGQSRSLTITLTNVGSRTLGIYGITLNGAPVFRLLTNTCGSSVAAGKSCTITVIFRPNGSGSYLATLSVSDNGGGSPQIVHLYGLGRPPL